MAASRDLGEFIRELRNNARISLRQLAQQAGVSNPYLSQIERGLRKPSAEVLQQIANALRVSTPMMYLRAGLLAEKEGHDVLAAIAADPGLTDRQKQTLIEIYEAFRRENLRAESEKAQSAEAATGAAMGSGEKPETGKGAAEDTEEAEKPTATGDTVGSKSESVSQTTAGSEPANAQETATDSETKPSSRTRVKSRANRTRTQSSRRRSGPGKAATENRTDDEAVTDTPDDTRTSGDA